MKRVLSILLSIIMVISISACKKTEQIVSDSGTNSQTVESSAGISNVPLNNSVTVSVRDDVIAGLKKSDVYQDYLSDNNYTEIICEANTATVNADGVNVKSGKITISEDGVYCLTGTFNGTVVIDGTKDTKVVLILNNINIIADNNAAVYVKKADKVTVLIPEGTTNTLTDSKKRSSDDENVTACIYSKSSLAIAGTGKLNIVGNYKDGITSKGNLVITGGELQVEAEDDALVGKDSITITEGSFSLKAGGHGLKTSNEDEEKGYAYIVGGTFDITAEGDGINTVSDLTIENVKLSISAEDDGVHSDKTLTINSGSLYVSQSNEGLEALVITINGGDITIISTDDGINANGKETMGFGGFNRESSEADSSSGETGLIINGGNIRVNADGDGLDSNGYISMTGGVVFVSGPTEDMNNATDYAGTFIITGGIIVATGSSGMYQSISAGSTKGSIDYISKAGIAAGTSCSLKNESGEEILSFEIEKRSSAILIAGEGINAGEGYILTIGDSAENVTANEGGSYENSSFGGFGGGFGGNKGNFGGGFNNGNSEGKFGDENSSGSFGDGNMTPPNADGMTPPNTDGATPPDFEGMTPPEGFEGNDRPVNPFGDENSSGNNENTDNTDKNNGL